MIGKIKILEFTKILLFEFFTSIIIIFISLWHYLLGNGFFEYADQIFYPLTFYHYHFVTFDPVFRGTITQIFAYTRTVIAGPGILLSSLTQDLVLNEKIFILYTFIIFFAFSYILAEIIYRIAKNYLNLNYGFWGKELLKLFIVIAIYSNLAIMNLNVDGGTWADGLIMLFMAITVAFSIYSKNKFNVISVSAVLLSISLLLDPDYYLGYILVLFFSMFLNFNYSLKDRLKLSIYPILISILVAIYISIGIVLTASGIPAQNPLAGRLATQAAGYSVAMNPITSILFLGYYWSTYAISPPSVLFFVGKDIITPYFGNIVILPNSWITYVWIFFLSLYPVIAISSFYYKDTRKISLPFGMMWLIGFIMTLWYEIPLINKIFIALAEIPFIGPAISTTIALPEHYMNIEGIAEVVLIFIVLLNLIGNKFENVNKRKMDWIVFLIVLEIIIFISAISILYKLNSFIINASLVILTIFIIFVIFIVLDLSSKHIKSFFLKMIKYSKKGIKITLTVIIVLMIIFVGWQAFNGSFYPERAWNGTSQGVLKNPGPFDPVYIPSYVVDTINQLSSNTNYSVIFYNPYLPNNAPCWYQGGNGLNYLVFQNYSRLIKPYLEMENVKYVVTYNDPPFILNALNSSGLDKKFLGPRAYLYINNETMGQIYKANLLLNYSYNDQNFYILYGIFKSMGIIPVISNLGNNTIGFNEFDKKINILSSSFISSQFPLTKSINSTLQFSINRSITLPWAWWGGIGNNWLAGNGGPTPTSKGFPTTIYLYNGTFWWNAQNGSTVGLWYGNVTGPGRYVAIPLPDPFNNSGVVTVTFKYKETANFTGYLGIFTTYLYYPNGNRAGTQAENSQIVYFKKSTNWTYATYRFMLPEYTGWFYPAFSMNGSLGTVFIRDVNITYGIYKNPVGTSPYYAPFFMGNGSINLNKTGKLYMFVKGTGKINGINITNATGIWIGINAGKIKFEGNLSLITSLYINNSEINELLGNYTVYLVPYNNNLRLLKDGVYYKPYYNLDGQTFFATQMNNQSKIVISNIYALYYIYWFIVVILIFILILPIIINFRKIKIKL